MKEVISDYHLSCVSGTCTDLVCSIVYLILVINLSLLMLCKTYLGHLL